MRPNHVPLLLGLTLLPGCFLISPAELASRLREDGRFDSGVAADTGDTSANLDSADTGDTGDTGEIEDCDVDEDGVMSAECGGADCDDADASVNPATTEVCNDKDDNCEGTIDESTAADAAAWYADVDGDGFGDEATRRLACTQPDGYVSDNLDCDDLEAEVSPAAVDVCNGLDDDCDGYTDGALAVPAYAATIQAAIDASADGDTICVAAGTYDENVDFHDHSVTLEGAGSEMTVIDGGGVTRPVTINDASISPTLRGFTLTGGQSPFGAGLYVMADNPVLDDLVITENRCTTATDCLGTGLYLSGEATLTDITISDNEAIPIAAATSVIYGVGAYVYDGGGSWTNVSILRNTGDESNASAVGYLLGIGLCVAGADIDFTSIDVSWNTGTIGGSAAGYAVGEGAGILADSDVSSWEGVTVDENTLDLPAAADNAAGAGLYLSRSNNRFSHLDVRGNQAAGGTIFGGALYVDDTTTVSFTNAIFAGNASTAVGSANGTIELESTSAATFTNVTVVGNDVDGAATRGGGFYLNGTANPILVNVTVTDNTLTGTNKATGGAVFRYTSASTGFAASYSNFYGNSVEEFDGLSTPVGSSGNIAVTPDFYDSHSRDPLGWNLMLVAGSGLIDAGTGVDADGSVADVGAYGGVGSSW